MKIPNVKGINEDLQLLITISHKREKNLAWGKLGSGTAKFLTDAFSEMSEGEMASCLNYLIREAKIKRK